LCNAIGFDTKAAGAVRIRLEQAKVHQTEGRGNRPDASAISVPIGSREIFNRSGILSESTEVGSFWLIADSLRDVNISILIRSSSRDEIMPPSHAVLVMNNVADSLLVRHEIISAAGHTRDYVSLEIQAITKTLSSR